MVRNTDNPMRRLPGRSLLDRTTGTILLSGALVLCLGALRDEGNSGLHVKQFWDRKFQWAHGADVVAAGDSRVLCGVSPAIVSEGLGGLRVRNFGFNGAVWSREYFDAIEVVLDPAARRRMILLGISPHSCTPRMARHNGFHQRRDDAASRSALYRRFDSVLLFFEPMSIKDTLRRTLRHTPHRYRRQYTPDGWAATVRIQDMPHRAVRWYQELFRGNPVSDEITAELMGRVARWRGRGIGVYGFRVPSTPELVALENRVSGFDEAAFVADFKAAGGVWIEMDQGAYPSFDGTHLNRTGAERLSRDLGEKVRRLSEPR